MKLSDSDAKALLAELAGAVNTTRTRGPGDIDRYQFADAIHRGVSSASRTLMHKVKIGELATEIVWDPSRATYVRVWFRPQEDGG